DASTANPATGPFNATSSRSPPDTSRVPFPSRSPQQSPANAADGRMKPPPAGRLRRASNPSSPVQHHLEPPATSCSLQCSWHTFFQERVLHLELTVQPFQLAQPGALGYLQRRFVFRVLLPVGAHPVPERRLADLKFPGHISDGA